MCTIASQKRGNGWPAPSTSIRGPSLKLAPDRINAPNQHQTQCSRVLSIKKLFRITEQHVHVRIDALKLALVFRLAPLETDDDLGTDSAKRIRECFPV